MPSPPTPRTTAILVEGLIEVQNGVSLDPFIATANLMVTQLCGNSGYTDGFQDSQMELIERWLSAHFYAVFDNQLTMAKAGSVTVGYQQKIDLGLWCTEYGQAAMQVDTAGNLAKFANSLKIKRNIKISIDWLGTRYNCLGDVDFGGLWADLTVES